MRAELRSFEVWTKRNEAIRNETVVCLCLANRGSERTVVQLCCLPLPSRSSDAMTSPMSVRRLGVRGRDVCPVCKQSLEAEYDSSRVLDPTDAHDAHILCVKEVEGVSKVPQFRSDYTHRQRLPVTPSSFTDHAQLACISHDANRGVCIGQAKNS